MGRPERRGRERGRAADRPRCAGGRAARSTCGKRTIDVNLTGVFLTSKHGIQALVAAGGGSVICTASPTSLFGFAVGFDAYTASEAGVLGLMRVMAMEYAEESIRVNAVMPGFVDTPLSARSWPIPRSATACLAGSPPDGPGEVASLMPHVASDDASYVTRAALAVDGGQTAI